MKLLLAVFILLSAARAQPIESLFGTDIFARAYRLNREISFDPFQKLDWEAKARVALPWLNLDRPTSAQIARLETFEAAGPDYRSVQFRAPMDAAVRRTTYLLIYDTGVTPFTPEQLSGEVSFFFKENMAGLDRRVVSGRVLGRPQTSVTSAAFVIRGRQGDVTEIRPARIDRTEGFYEYLNQGRMLRWKPHGEFNGEVRSALAFRLGKQQYLLVRWELDVCNSSYSLFTVGGTLIPIAGNGYDCDV